MSVRKKHTQAELAEAIIFPVSLNEAQKREAAIELTEARERNRRKVSKTDKLALQLLQLKFKLEDYLEGKEYDPAQHFGYFLKEYIDILELKRKAFAAEISIDETMLSQLINMHRLPPDYISVRLELHSNNIIPADYWFKLVEKQREFFIRTNKELRRKEKKFVHKFALGI